MKIEKIKAETYIRLIEDWATERGLDKSSSDKQLIKLQEEVGELAEAHNKEWKDKQVDSIGDVFVVLTIYALQNGLRIDDCIKEAYDTIKSRKGKMIDGVFVKQADLLDIPEPVIEAMKELKSHGESLADMFGYAEEAGSPNGYAEWIIDNADVVGRKWFEINEEQNK